MMSRPQSCDTFVALPPATSGCVVFGKNSDRPCAEVQEVIYVSAADHEPGSKVQCTYIEVEQIAHTYAVMLSRPSWLWGAEMGSNEHGVCIGNEAVWTKLNGPDDLEERLLGMDLVRLGLERAKTAKEALDVMCDLLTKHGQGGRCSEELSDKPWSYHNSFLIADSSEAWVLETAGPEWAAENITTHVRRAYVMMKCLASSFASVIFGLGLERGRTSREALDAMTTLLEKYGQGGTCSDDGNAFGWSYHNSYLICDGSDAWVLETLGRHWAAEHITSGVRNISNQLTIRTKIDAMSPGLKEYAKSQGWWNGEKDFDFAKVYSDSFEETELQKNQRPSGRQLWGRKLLEDFSQEGKFTVADMFKILRHKESGICMTGAFLSTGSQVSLLRPAAGGAPSCHWFTATPNPSQSFFKPFIFTNASSIGDQTTSPDFGDTDPAKVKPRFQKQVDRQHPLWKAHKKLQQWLNTGDEKGQELLSQIQELEAHCVADMEEVTSNFNDTSKAKVAAIFQHMVDLEMNFYK